MNKYQSYKPSDIIWIDSIPSHWVSSKLKFVLNRIVTGGTPDTSNDSFWSDEGGFNWISISDMTSNPNGIEFTRKKISDIGLENKRLEVLPINSIIYSICGSIGKVNKLKIESTIHQGILGLIPNTLIENDFLNYYLKYIQDFVSILSSSNTQENLNLDKVRNIGIVIPPIQEQIQIIKFLDKKTDLLDNLISKKEKIISILNEQRTLIINQVVTKGLNPDVKMKDSDEEWIGDIPENWGVFKMKYGVTLINEKGLTTKEDVKISPENVESMTGVCFNFYSEYEGEGMRFKKGDILLNKLRLYLKKIVFTEVEGYSMGEMIVLRCSKKLFNRYFYFLIFHQGLIDLLNSQSNGVKLPRVSPEIIMNSLIPFPPLNEQFKIVEHLDFKTKEIDDLIHLEQKKIDLLKEYRQSLISDVVTGKIKVTN